MKRVLVLWFVAVVGCSGDDDACDPECNLNACMVCDASGSPRCVSACAEALECQDSRCVAPAEVACSPSCGECQACDTSGSSPVCVDRCAADLLCNAGVCQSPACDPTCGPCQTCDTSGSAPSCIDNCEPGMVCNAGVCEPPACDPACGPCQVCDTIADPPSCVSICGTDQFCDVDVCRRDSLHAHLAELSTTFASGPEVTTTCLNCHAEQGEDILKTAHFLWLGETPGLDGDAPGADVGKKNLINNFCIAIVSNEARCSQCHAGYGWKDDTFSFSDATNIDCLVCHADPAEGYKKEPKTAGLPPTTLDLGVVARSVGEPVRANCGACHFTAGGGDNVKKGDLGSALVHPTEQTDVHMGRGMSCADCHRGEGHTLLGQGVHLPVSEGRIDCSDCHGIEPHTGTMADYLNNHALDVACQTCHIRAFSRQQPTKMSWDWSTAGNRTRGTDGVETGTLTDGTVVQMYNYMKGDFVWQKEVRPTYGWYNGETRRMTTESTFAEGMGTQNEPVQLGTPIATKADADAKIFPFKVMRGRQPADSDGRFMIVPKLFGPGGFWAGIPDAASYDPATVAALWNTALTAGARAAEQVASNFTYTSSDWQWAYTVLYLGINHEVAPASEALGCTDCHGNAEFDFEALGYGCEDPLSPPDPNTCNSRH